MKSEPADYPIGYANIAEDGAKQTPFVFSHMERDDIHNEYRFFFDIGNEDDFHVMIPLDFEFYEGVESPIVSIYIFSRLEHARRQYETSK